jgi:hypothetical protein
MAADVRRIARHAALVVVAAVAGMANAGGHEFSPAFLGFTQIDDGRFDVQWKVSISGGLADALTPQLPEVCRFSGAMHSYVTGDARIQQREIRCDAELAGQQIAIAGLAGTMTDVLLRIAYRDGSSYTQLLTPSAAATTVPAAQGLAAVAASYVVLGTEHILGGVDHLLFVLALILLVNDLRRLILTVTAFTLAHSVTLGAATLGYVRLAQSPVEAVIALSIVFLASELARNRDGRPERRDLTMQFPWLVAFAFGLLHGFGFAGALAEVGLPANAVPVALLFFNVGVELGQLAFIGAVLLAIGLWRAIRLPAPPVLRLTAAYAMGSIAAYWVLDRTIGTS